MKTLSNLSKVFDFEQQLSVFCFLQALEAKIGYLLE
jgi:hypothetical protein